LDLRRSEKITQCSSNEASLSCTFLCLGLLVGVRDSGYEEEEEGGARSHGSLVVEEKEEPPKQPGQRSGR